MPNLEKHYSPKEIAEIYSVGRETARRWIMQMLGDDVAMLPKNRGRGKRKYRLRRIPQSVLEREIGNFINHRSSVWREPCSGRRK
jgi:transposase